MTYKSFTEDMYENYAMRFPLRAEDTIDCFRSGKWELTVIFSDGSRAVYNDMTKSIRYLNYTSRFDPGDMNDETWTNEFSTRLSKLLQTQMMSQKDLSERTGISVVSLSKYMNGKGTPNIGTLHRIARALKCSVAELIDFDY